MIRFCSRAPLAVFTVLVFAGGTIAQATVPHWSSYFGSTGYDEAWVVKPGPGGLLTVAGHTDSNGLATAGAYQTAMGGVVDAFVARVDPSLPPGQQLLWCTYLGGAGLEFVFDAEVDAQGFTTVVGLTMSGGFPVANGFQTTRNGASDGFVARLDPLGATLAYSTFLGGSMDDRICEVEVAASGVVTIAGVTESSNLPGTAGTIFPSYHGGITDAFVGRLDPSQPPAQQLLWTTHIGGAQQEGIQFNTWLLRWGGWLYAWEGNLARMGLAVESPRFGGSIVVSTQSGSTAAPTTPGCYQPNNAGSLDVYVVRLNATGTSLLYGTFFGDSNIEAPYALALHPTGGVVVGGSTRSLNLPTTPGCLQPTNRLGSSFGVPNDGFLCWIDPGGNGPQDLQYGTFFGGDGGEDGVLAVAIESSGLATVAGYATGASNFHVTPGCLQPTARGGQYTGMIARIAMYGQGAGDLMYSTYVGGSGATLLFDLALDEVGDAYLAGATYSTAYPAVNPFQPTRAGALDACITHLPLLPGRASRSQLALATPACGVPLYTGMGGALVSGTTFSVTATNAPARPATFGLLVLGTPLTTSQPLFNVQLLVNPVDTTVHLADALGHARYAIAVPAGLPPMPLNLFAAQWLFLTNATCPGSGVLAASEMLYL